MIPEALKPFMSPDDGTAWPTGSRYICNPPVMDTDDDYVILANGGDCLVGQMSRHGFVETGHADEYPEDGVFATMRRDDINLVITDDEVFYGRFIAATEVARKLNLRDKPARLALFQAVLYGNTDGLALAMGAK